MSVAEAAEPIVRQSTKRFYRPELDALRFFAFLSVLIHHGPTSLGLPDLIVRMGAFGLSMFFLLSAYLITELLVREREQTGTVAWSFSSPVAPCESGRFITRPSSVHLWWDASLGVTLSCPGRA
ncbi:MAG: hypothetical protein WDO73_25780 [Ignavibacteriota bacterium]